MRKGEKRKGGEERKEGGKRGRGCALPQLIFLATSLQQAVSSFKSILIS